MDQRKTFNDISRGANKTGMSPMTYGKVIIQEPDHAPVVIRDNPVTQVKETENSIVSVSNAQGVEIKSKPLVESQRDKIADTLVKNLEETGIIITKALTLTVSNYCEPQLYYEAVSRAGDTFLIHIQYKDKAIITYIPGEGKESSKEMIIGEGQVLPMKSKNFSTCAADAICSKVFSCSEGTGQCNAAIQKNYITGVKKYYTPEGSGGNSVLHYGDNPLSYPVFSYYEYINNPKKVTEDVAKLTAEIHTKAFENNKVIVTNAKMLLDTVAKSAADLLEAFDMSSKQTEKQNEYANTLIKGYFDSDVVLNDAQKANYDMLVSRKMAFNQLVGNLVKMVDTFYDDMKIVNESNEKFVVNNVKLWAQSKLRLDAEESKRDVWSLPAELTKLTRDELENIFAGDDETLQRNIKAFLDRADVKTTLKDFNKRSNGMDTDVSTFDELKQLVMTMKTSELVIVKDKNNNGAVETKIWFRSQAIVELHRLVSLVQPTLMMKIEDNLNKGVCKKDNVCLSYDKEKHKLSVQAGGTLPGLSSFKESELKGGSTANEVGLNPITDVIERLLNGN